MDMKEVKTEADGVMKRVVAFVVAHPKTAVIIGAVAVVAAIVLF
jgi:hypothetical protein